MIRKLLLGLVLLVGGGIAAMVLFAGGPSYKTDLPPPASLDAVVWPPAVGGQAADIQPLQASLSGTALTGATARYGEGTSITVVNTADQAALDAHVATIVDRLKVYGSRSSGKLNGAWWVRASGTPGRIYAWQNGTWFYSIEAVSDEAFAEIVAAFPYISAD